MSNLLDCVGNLVYKAVGMVGGWLGALTAVGPSRSGGARGGSSGGEGTRDEEDVGEEEEGGGTRYGAKATPNDIEMSKRLVYYLLFVVWRATSKFKFLVCFCSMVGLLPL